MNLQFERGDQQQPKGHALVYFQSGQDPTAILATYLVVLPVPLELGKYLPPLLAERMPGFSGTAPAVVPMPPVPEQVQSLAHLQRLANARDDDLIFGGTLNAGDLQGGMQAAAELAERYLALYNDFANTLETVDAVVEGPAEKESELDVREVMYSLMGEHDRLQELSKLTGQLRYAIDGGDAQLVAETVAEMGRLGKYLAPKYHFEAFLQAAQTPGDRGRRLAALYMDRCYRLYKEDYTGLAKVEAELKELESGS